MLEVHRDLLWLGNAFDIREPRPIFELEIKAVVDVSYEEKPAQLPRQLTYCRFPLNDGAGNDDRVLLLALQTLVDLLASEIRTIIGCSAGMSRSPTLAAFALAAHLDQQANEIVEQISKQKGLEIKGPFWNEVETAFSRLRTRKP